MRNEAKSGLIDRDEWHKEALAEMTPGEFVASLAIMVSVLFLVLAFLWIAEPMRQQAEAQRVEVAK